MYVVLTHTVLDVVAILANDGDVGMFARIDGLNHVDPAIRTMFGPRNPILAVFMLPLSPAVKWRVMVSQ